MAVASTRKDSSYKHNNPDLLIGWEQIGEFFGKTGRALLNRRKEMMDAGVVFYQWFGRPRRRMVFAFKSVLIKWTMMKSQKGEMI